MIYIALPYSHPDPKIREQRFKIANRYAGYLIQRGHVVVSSISMGVPIAEECNLDDCWATWRNTCILLLLSCNEMHVLCLDGWKESIGLQEEIKKANEMDIHIEYISGQCPYLGIAKDG